jgi:coenzyme PQQ biosynthesis protein PqqD
MSFDDQRRLCLARGVRLQTDPANGEPILLFPEGVLYLSATANDIVRRCDGQSSALNIISSLADEYEVNPDTLRGDVLECLVELHQRKLVVFSE